MANIRKRRGKWQVQVRRLGSAAHTKTFAARKDAETWARFIEGQLDRAHLPVDVHSIRNTSLGDLLRRYLREITPAKRSAYAEESRIRTMLADQIGETSLASLSSPAILGFAQRRMRTVSSETARKDLKLIRHALRIARQRWGIRLPADPFDEIELPPPCKPRSRRLKTGELDRLRRAAASCRNPSIGNLLELAIETGMRRGELLRLDWHHINLENATIHIHVTKTDEPRTIPITVHALGFLKSTWPEAERRGRLFPITANAARLAWERLRERAGIQGLRLHDLRHEAISRFFELGLNVPEVALISGHRDPRMLFRYTHLTAEQVGKKLCLATKTLQESTLSDGK